MSLDIEKIYKKIYARMTNDEKIICNSLFSLKTAQSLIIPTDMMMKIIFKLFNIKIRYIENGDLSTVEVDTGTRFLILVITGITSLSNYIKDFNGHLFIENCDELEILENNFMTAPSIVDNDIQSISFAECPKLFKIGDYVMNRCEKLEILDCSNWVNLKSIGKFFMLNCKKLHRILCATWENITVIDDGFLIHCVNIESISFSEWKHLTVIKNSFLKGCNKLKTVDCSGFIGVSSVGDAFMYNCSSLTRINLTSLRNLVSIGNTFMCECHNLKQIECSNWYQLKFVGNYFLSDCVSLKIIICTSWVNIKVLGDFFMNNCYSVKSVRYPRGLTKNMISKFLTPLTQEYMPPDDFYYEK